MNDAHEQALQVVRIAVRNSKKSGYLPGIRTAFSTFDRTSLQGGPNTGVFLQITCDHKNDVGKCPIRNTLSESLKLLKQEAICKFYRIVADAC